MAQRILFLSEKNTSWTLLAEASARILIPDAEVLSAGTVPNEDGRLPRSVLCILRETNAPVDLLKSKSLGDIGPLAFDAVILDKRVPFDVLQQFTRIGMIYQVPFDVAEPAGDITDRMNTYRERHLDIGRWIQENLVPSDNLRHAADRAMQFITWVDDRRKSLYERTSVVLAADSILAAAAFVLLTLIPKVFVNTSQSISMDCHAWWYVCFLMIAAGLLLGSIGLSTCGLGNIFKTRRKLWTGLDYPDKMSLPDCFPFYPPGISDLPRTYHAYQMRYASILTSDVQLIEAATEQFRVACEEFRKRYRRHFRWSVRLLLFSILPFFGALITLVVALSTKP